MNQLLVILLILLLCGGGGFYVGQPVIGGSAFGLVLAILLILALTGNLK